MLVSLDEQRRQQRTPKSADHESSTAAHVSAPAASSTSSSPASLSSPTSRSPARPTLIGGLSGLAAYQKAAPASLPSPSADDALSSRLQQLSIAPRPSASFFPSSASAARPARDATVAKRLVLGHLGLRAEQTEEQKAAEKEQRRLHRLQRRTELAEQEAKGRSADVRDTQPSPQQRRQETGAGERTTTEATATANSDL
jgi:hypothetical protein